MLRINYLILFIMCSKISYGSFFTNIKEKKFLICYGKLDPESIKGYEHLILESEHYTKEDISKFKKNNTKVLAYISLGEVHPSVPYYKDILPHTFGKNNIWGGNYLLLNKIEAQQIIITRITELRNRGFDGFFFDNIDNFTIHGSMHDQKDSLIHFLTNLREKFPKLFFLQNAGLPLLEQTNQLIDGILIESIATDYDFEKKKYQLRDKKTYKQRKEEVIKHTQAVTIPVMVVEYTDSKKLKRKAKKRVQHKNWTAFFSSIELQELPNY